MAITSIDIDMNLLEEAKEVLGATSNRDTVQKALEYTLTMLRQRIAFDRIANRTFTDEQINAPKVDY